MFVSAALIALGLLLLLAGGELLLRGAVGLATLLRLTPAVIGLTVVAAGTSVPELAVSGAAAFRGSVDIAVANVVGSNIFNLTVIVGLCAVVRPIAITGGTIKLEYPVLVLVTLLALVVMQDGVVNRLDAALCLAVYAGFTAYLVGLVRKQVTAEEARELKAEVTERSPGGVKRPRWWVCLILVAGGVALLAAGAELTVAGASDLARAVGWSDRLIGLTVVSAGTGLPEVVASLVSSLRGRTDVALGNAIGSNLFNLLAVLGVTALASPLPVPAEVVSGDGWWMLGTTLLLFPLMATGLTVRRWEGVVLLIAYAAYMGWLLSAAG